MPSKYEFKAIELKWQEHWDKIGLFKAADVSAKPKYYCLMMFPYPSGTLHVGHGRNYIIGDAVSRYKIMKGFNLMTPMGWDAFGLPAENAAIRRNIHPRKYTLDNIVHMKDQFRKWGVGYDWDREVTACNPDYYKWTQWLFLKLFEKGLAYKKPGGVNWCDNCKTVLANEQVVDGVCERCETPVIQKYLDQWYFKITDYADRLLDDLELLEKWPDRVKTMQENWIGKSEGVEIFFKLASSGETLSCFTTRPDTIFGVTFMVVAPEHPLVKKLAEKAPNGDEIMSFVSRVSRDSIVNRTSADSEKEGLFLHEYVVNPMNNEKIPLWVANYALLDYGTGAVMAVPAHDQRDFLFAKKYNFGIKVVINPAKGEPISAETMKEAFIEDGVQVNSGQFDGLPNRFSLKKIIEFMETNKVGRATTSYRLRDWLISRQRFWGAPIPIVYCEKCGIVPVPVEKLPVLLPEENVKFKPTGQSPLVDRVEFVNTECPKCGGYAKREVETMDTFVDSSWYYCRYISPHDTARPFDTELVNKWLPVDQYIGGVEHAILHLMYSRFITKVLYDDGLVNFDEPFTSLFTQGMICKDSYWCPKCGAYQAPADVENGKTCRKCNTEVVVKNDKMSKSKLNVISPNDLMEKFGADTQRLYILFIGPPEKDAEWSDDSVYGASRFLKKLWETVTDNVERLKNIPASPAKSAELPKELKALHRKTHLTVKKVSEEMEGAFKFNTAISAVMELVGVVRDIQSFDKAGREELAVLREALEASVKLLAPFVPHICEELWTVLGHEPSVFQAGWPAYDAEALKQAQVQVVVQVNGKVRGRVTAETDADEDALRKLVLADENVKKFVADKEIKNFVVVPNRLVNIVV
jgi:leucyl-tRNA synthetase